MSSCGRQWESPWPGGGWQRPDHWVEGLRAQPWWEPHEIGWAAELERQYPAIKAELAHALLLQPARRVAVGSDGGGSGGRDGGIPEAAAAPSSAGRWDEVGSVQKTDFADKALVAAGGRWREFVLLGAEVDYAEQQRRNQVR